MAVHSHSNVWIHSQKHDGSNDYYGSKEPSLNGLASMSSNCFLIGVTEVTGGQLVHTRIEVSPEVSSNMITTATYPQGTPARSR